MKQVEKFLDFFLNKMPNFLSYLLSTFQIQFIRVPQKTGIIEVDGVEVAKGEIAGDSTYLRTTSPLYVGGRPSDYTPKGIEVSRCDYIFSFCF